MRTAVLERPEYVIPMVNFLLGIAVGIAAVLVAEFLFFTQGGMPVSARNGQPMPLERFVTGRALQVATGQDAKRPSPIPADAPNLLAGAKVYRENCALCHGAPGAAPRSPVAQGMFPRPPKLMPPDKGVSDDPVGETYWKVKNGIRLTGMPGFEGALTDTELWQVSLLLLKSDQLPDSVKETLR